MKSQDNDNPYADDWDAFKKGLSRYHYPCYESFSDERSWVDGWDNAERRANDD